MSRYPVVNDKCVNAFGFAIQPPFLCGLASAHPVIILYHSFSRKSTYFPKKFCNRELRNCLFLPYFFPHFSYFPIACFSVFRPIFPQKIKNYTKKPPFGSCLCVKIPFSVFVRLSSFRHRAIRKKFPFFRLPVARVSAVLPVRVY